jgi:hypothetical protein
MLTTRLSLLSLWPPDAAMYSSAVALFSASAPQASMAAPPAPLVPGISVH